MDSQAFQELLYYPEQRWGKEADSRWRLLCDRLANYGPPRQTFEIDTARKWELVSAFQKSVRRADKGIALSLVSAMNGMPEQYAYFWRRLCVVACEDVGPADDTLAKFVVACATLFARKKTGPENYRFWCFLAEQMCNLPNRSRVYCSYGILDLAITRSELPQLTATDAEIIQTILDQRRWVLAGDQPSNRWQRKNDWRTEGLLRFVGMTSPTQLTLADSPLPASKILFDLPSYCYDMHTRVGLEMLRRLVRGVAGAECIEKFFRHNQAKGAHRALGAALFFEEGGRIQGELVYGPLCSLEQRFFAHQYGLRLDDWWELRFVVRNALENGIVDRVREKVLMEVYGQKTLQFVCQ